MASFPSMIMPASKLGTMTTVIIFYLPAFYRYASLIGHHPYCSPYCFPTTLAAADSLSVTVRLNTSRPGTLSLSTA